MLINKYIPQNIVQKLIEIYEEKELYLVVDEPYLFQKIPYIKPSE
jgi:hypothetical protein